MTVRYEPPNPRERLIIANISGGKDSTAMALWLIEQGIEHRRVFADTGWEHADTYDYLNRLQDVIGSIDVVRAPLPMAALIRKKGMFPGRTRRFCTTELKVKPLLDYQAKLDPTRQAIIAIGIRNEESAARAKLEEWEHDANGMERWVWRPLIRWALEDVIAIHTRHAVRPNPLYLRGAERVGCWPCIYARKAELRMVAHETPARIDEIEALERELQERRDAKIAASAEYAAKAEEFFAPTFFRRPGAEIGIRDAVEWSRTARGGKQFELFDTRPDPGCMRWGLCEAAPETDD